MGFAGRIREAAFRFRSFTPIPFLILAVAFARPVLWGLVTGFFMICIGELLRFWAVSVAGGETRTTRIPHGRGGLVTDGPFAYLRNPMYVGNLIIYSGVGIMSMAMFPWLLLVGLLCFVFQYALIITYEEDFLKGRFGPAYAEYALRVNRFLPRLSQHSGAGHARGNPAVGLRSERRTLQAEVLVVVLFIGIYVTSWGQG
jgi:protein-S-isoprenylcysteine O-methyltransferase Ste14